MLKKEKIDRINHLAKKSRGEGLNDEEKKEQEQLRKEYIEKFREHFKGHLSRVKFVEDLSEEACGDPEGKGPGSERKREKRTKLVYLRQREASSFLLFLFYN